MASITIRNIPDYLHQLLKESAQRHHRSINGEILSSLERYLGNSKLDPASQLTSARKLRKKCSQLYLTDEILHAAKEMGRP